MKNIVLNIPHSSINGIFNPEYGKWEFSEKFVNDCVCRWTDWFTDFLFSELFRQGNVYPVIFPYSRFVCDAERLINDCLNNKGQGIIYTNLDGYHRGDLDERNIDYLNKLWLKHQDKLAKRLTDNSILIDCHSFPSDLYDTDICVGYNDDWSYDERIVESIISTFQRNDYKVCVNKPYSNSITPKCDAKYSSVMIEVNKRVYMNEDSLRLICDEQAWSRWNRTLNDLYTILL